ncbi:MAG: succinate dehydrogenase, cytochrome b556 subunit [Paracoccaceae bacterium]|jgi:succinate dehydrogenase / fumarate reductase cytochrome b subunit
MAVAPRTARPLSPHLQIYRVQLTSVTSILTRITGQALMAGVVLAVWWLFSAAISPAYFVCADAVVRSWFGALVFTGSLWALWYHYLSGLRHLIFDAGIGLDIPTAQKLGWVCIIGSVVLTAATLLVI